MKKLKKNKEKKEKDMAIPVALISALAPVVTRLIDKDKPLGKTNVTTVTGSGLMGVAYMLINYPNEIGQAIGYVVGLIGVLVTLYKENKK